MKLLKNPYFWAVIIGIAILGIGYYMWYNSDKEKAKRAAASKTPTGPGTSKVDTGGTTSAQDTAAEALHQAQADAQNAINMQNVAESTAAGQTAPIFVPTSKTR